MTGLTNFDELSVQFKIYLLILHTVVLGLAVHILVSVFYIRKESELPTKHSSGVRIVHVDDKRVTVESCQWINSILNWMHTNTSTTPDLVKIWLAMLNEKLKDDKNSLNFKINSILPGSLPPTFTNVYCSDLNNGSTQCIALHIETTKLGFLISLLDNNNAAIEPTSNVEVNVTKLSGQVMFQVLTRKSQYDLTIKFIGDPELKVSTQDVTKDSERSAIEETLKEVICKTVINIPLTDGKPSDENTAASEASSSCVDLDGKLLVKVIKASELTGKEETDNIDAFCVITCREPRQKKKTISMKGSKEPFWNEPHVFDITKKTKELEFDIYNELKTPKEKNFHMDDFSDTSGNTGPDFLGQVIVPLTMVAKDQTCRLILPILPISNKTSYVTGQISLEFSYDKDGKGFEQLVQNNSSEVTAKKQVVPNKSQDEEKGSPQRLVFSMATIDIVEDENDELHLVPLEDHGKHREDIIVAEQRVFDRLPPSDIHDEISAEENRKHEEMLQELKELDRRSADDEPKTAEESSETISSTQVKIKATSPVQISVEPPSCSQVQKSPPVDNVEGASATTIQNIEVDETLMEGITPETRRKVFREVFNQRINSNSSSGEVADQKDQETKTSPVQPYTAKPAQLQVLPRSGSDLSLSSLYEGTKSVLVVEAKDRGETKHYQIPLKMARRGTFDHKGTKLHICSDHLFIATHFTGSLPSCGVCKLPLTGYFGKQGYQCRDCQLITHKRCHVETNVVCPTSTVSTLKIKKAASIVGYN